MTFGFTKHDKGMTLVEATITMLLFSIIIAAILATLAVARNSWQSGGSQLSVQQEARRGLNAMTEELRQLRLSTIAGVPADGGNYSSITFQIPQSITESGTTWSTNIQYSLGGLNSAQVLRTQGGNQRVLANDISSLAFTRNAATPDVINIIITGQKNTFPGFSVIQSNITLDTEIKVRNQ